MFKPKQEEKLVITNVEIQELKRVKKILENPSFAMKASNYIGRPIELGLEKINSEKLTKITEKALHKSLDLAISSLNKKNNFTVSNAKHKGLAVLSGGVGGMFGLMALAVELPISTTIMLRSIADIAESQGHDLNELETRLACLEVFSLGSSKSTSDDGAESAYFSTRGAIALEMKLAIDSVANMSNKAIQEALAKGQLPMFIKVVNSIASRFGITLSEKLVAQSIPLVGAVGGASLNFMFINHFQKMAEGHFVVKRLEKKYGSDEIHQLYNALNVEKVKK
ncbi:MAG: Staphylolytic protease preproenzyme LasA [uncultured Sulfurovum sp.]|uniref:Staphylolytic protease preproenzyme LasA n=1 Tax=uncultured Sulfurovum sp. TaxID=269237 RepID=A0A6S6S7S0_9BACT|nr:MAG: Staphylolytic protease preproenzyme LasA [uncultured Sulfurovum sp.]